MQNIITTKRNGIPAVLLAAMVMTMFLMTSLLTGCQTAKKELPKAEMSLMERYHSGKHLIHDDTTMEADANLTPEQQEARAHLARGRAFEEQERPELAFEQYSRAAKLDPKLTQARYHRGRQLLSRGLSMQALREFTVVTQQTPEYAPGHLALGRVYFANGLYPEAEKHILTALSHDSGLTSGYELLGIIRNHDRRYNEALQAFTSALSLQPDTPRIYNNMGLTLSMAGRNDEAVEAFRTAIRKGESSPRIYNNLALSLCRLGRTGEAIEAFTAASDEATAWNNLGYFLFLDGQHEAAVAAFHKAIELKPTFYIRAAENLKRARLAARFASKESAPVHSGDGVVQSNPAPRAPASFAAPAQMQVTPASYAPQQQNTTPVVSPMHKKPAIPAPMASYLNEQPPKAEPSAPSVERKHPPQPEVQTNQRPELSGPVKTSATVKRPGTTVKTETTQQSNNIQQGTTLMAPANSATPSATQTDNAALHKNIPAGNAATASAPNEVYSLHHSSFKTLSRAQAAAETLHNMQLEAHITSVTIPEKGQWHRVSIGTFPSAEEAHTAHKALVQLHPELDALRVVRNAIFTQPAHTKASTHTPVPSVAPAAATPDSQTQNAAPQNTAKPDALPASEQRFGEQSGDVTIAGVNNLQGR